MKAESSAAANGSRIEPSTVNSELKDAPPAFNEQTHYVPVKTIITVGGDPDIPRTSH